MELAVGKTFLLNDGRRLNDIADLAKALGSMSEQTFRAHVSDERNDFADWVQGVFDDPVLANEMRCAVSNLELIDALNHHITKQTPQESSLAMKFVPTSGTSGLISQTEEEAPPSWAKNEEPAQTPLEEMPSSDEPLSAPPMEEQPLSEAPEINTDYHEDAAPLVENEVLSPSSFSEPQQMVDASSVSSPEHTVVDGPEQAPVFDSNPLAISQESLAESAGEPLMPSGEQSSLLSGKGGLFSATDSTPASGAIDLSQTDLPFGAEDLLPPAKEGDDSNNGTPLLMRFLLLYQYILAALRLDYLKKKAGKETE